MDSETGSVTPWLRHLKTGDRAAAQPLWERYFPELVRMARQRLRDAPRRVADEEDVALSAFDSFCRAAADGRFPRLNDRHDLWQVLIVLTARKALHLRRDQGRQKRGGAVLDQGALSPGPDAAGGDALDQVLDRGPTPAFAAQVAEEYRRLMTALGDPTLQTIAQWRMEGYTTDEIADRLGCVPRTVERKLLLIRRTWSARAEAVAAGTGEG